MTMKNIKLSLSLLIVSILAACGGGGPSDSTTTAVAPVIKQALPLYETSYENKTRLATDSVFIPAAFNIPGLVLPTNAGFSARTLSWADFFQDGSYVAFSALTRWTGAYAPPTNPDKWPDAPAYAVFVRQKADGTWEDVTNLLIKDGIRETCISPGFSHVADLNNDGRPDVYLDCTGLDFLINGVYKPDDQISEQYVILSQPDGSYKVKVAGVGKIYGHGATLADIDNDGNIDVISVDPVANKIPLVLWGKGDGTFTLDNTRFPEETRNKNIYTVEAIKMNGQLKFILSGFSNEVFDPNDWTVIAGNINFGTKIFTYTNGQFVVEKDLTPYIPSVTATGRKYGLALDFLYDNGTLYTRRVSDGYSYVATTKTNIETGNSSIIYEAAGHWHPLIGDKWKLSTDGNFLLAFSTGCNAQVSSVEYCQFKVAK